MNRQLTETQAVKLTQHIAKQLCSLRCSAGISQTLAAEFAGVSKDTYGRHERGDYPPTVFALKRYAEVFRVSTDYLLGLTDVK